MRSKRKSFKCQIRFLGNGMKGKDAIKIKHQMSGVSGVLYKELQQRMKTLMAGLANIN